MEIRFKVRSRGYSDYSDYSGYRGYSGYSGYRGYSGYSGYSGAIEGCMRGIFYSGVAVDSMALLL